MVDAHWHSRSDVDDVAERYHSHQELESLVAGLESLVAGLREDLGRAESRIADLEECMHDHEQLSPVVSR